MKLCSTPLIYPRYPGLGFMARAITLLVAFLLVSFPATADTLYYSFSRSAPSSSEQTLQYGQPVEYSATMSAYDESGTGSSFTPDGVSVNLTSNATVTWTDGNANSMSFTGPGTTTASLDFTFQMGTTNCTVTVTPLNSNTGTCPDSGGNTISDTLSFTKSADAPHVADYDLVIAGVTYRFSYSASVGNGQVTDYYSAINGTTAELGILSTEWTGVGLLYFGNYYGNISGIWHQGTQGAYYPYTLTAEGGGTVGGTSFSSGSTTYNYSLSNSGALQSSYSAYYYDSNGSASKSVDILGHGAFSVSYNSTSYSGIVFQNTEYTNSSWDISSQTVTANGVSYTGTTASLSYWIDYDAATYQYHLRQTTQSNYAEDQGTGYLTSTHDENGNGTISGSASGIIHNNQWLLNSSGALSQATIVTPSNPLTDRNFNFESGDYTITYTSGGGSIWTENSIFVTSEADASYTISAQRTRANDSAPWGAWQASFSSNSPALSGFTIVYSADANAWVIPTTTYHGLSRSAPSSPEMTLQYGDSVPYSASLYLFDGTGGSNVIPPDSVSVQLSSNATITWTDNGSSQYFTGPGTTNAALDFTVQMGTSTCSITISPLSNASGSYLDANGTAVTDTVTLTKSPDAPHIAGYNIVVEGINYQFTSSYDPGNGQVEDYYSSQDGSYNTLTIVPAGWSGVGLVRFGSWYGNPITGIWYQGTQGGYYPYSQTIEGGGTVGGYWFYAGSTTYNYSLSPSGVLQSSYSGSYSDAIGSASKSLDVYGNGTFSGASNGTSFSGVVFQNMEYANSSSDISGQSVTVNGTNYQGTTAVVQYWIEYDAATYQHHLRYTTQSNYVESQGANQGAGYLTVTLYENGEGTISGTVNGIVHNNQWLINSSGALSEATVSSPNNPLASRNFSFESGSYSVIYGSGGSSTWTETSTFVSTEADASYTIYAQRTRTDDAEAWGPWQASYSTNSSVLGGIAVAYVPSSNTWMVTEPTPTYGFEDLTSTVADPGTPYSVSVRLTQVTPAGTSGVSGVNITATGAGESTTLTTDGNGVISFTHTQQTTKDTITFTIASGVLPPQVILFRSNEYIFSLEVNNATSPDNNFNLHRYSEVTLGAQVRYYDATTKVESPAGDAMVNFSVLSGDGSFDNNSSATVTTGPDGRASLPYDHGYGTTEVVVEVPGYSGDSQVYGLYSWSGNSMQIVDPPSGTASLFADAEQNVSVHLVYVNPQTGQQEDRANYPITINVDSGTGTVFNTPTATDSNGNFSFTYKQGSGQTLISVIAPGLQDDSGATVGAVFSFNELFSYNYWSNSTPSPLEMEPAAEAVMQTQLLYYDATTGQTWPAIGEQPVSISVVGDGTVTWVPNSSYPNNAVTDSNGLLTFTYIHGSGSSVVYIQTLDGAAVQTSFAVTGPPPPQVYAFDPPSGTVYLPSAGGYATLSATLLNVTDSGNPVPASEAEGASISINGQSTSWTVGPGGVVEINDYFTPNDTISISVSGFTNSGGGDATTVWTISEELPPVYAFDNEIASLSVPSGGAYGSLIAVLYNVTSGTPVPAAEAEGAEIYLNGSPSGVFVGQGGLVEINAYFNDGETHTITVPGFQKATGGDAESVWSIVQEANYFVFTPTSATAALDGSGNAAITAQLNNIIGSGEPMPAEQAANQEIYINNAPTGLYVGSGGLVDIIYAANVGDVLTVTVPGFLDADGNPAASEWTITP